jgi:phenylpyruvate tautomerase PptA (4-oxalocrotonate tautomerase family)
MTVITVNTLEGRFDVEQRRTLARTLTDAVLIPEVGQFEPAARVGFQVHFVERSADRIAIGGALSSDTGVDVILVDIAVMDADWSREVRADVIQRILAVLADAVGLDAPLPSWWVNVRIIEDGSWGSRGEVTTILGLLDSGVFTPEKVEAIRAKFSS